MKLWHIILASIGLILILTIGFPMVASAVGGGDALAGLKEYYAFLVELAQKGLEGYIEFLGAL